MNNTLKAKINSSYKYDENDEHFIPDGMNEVERSVKRAADFLLAMACLVAASPLFAICYVMVKKEDGGPAIFKQERIGRFGRPFYMYKFRSMVVDAEKDGPQLFQPTSDKRLTKVGAFLRRHHLDELPQLINVLKGEMSFVGPRPERRYYINLIMERDPRYAYLYQIRPGITSFATLYNGYTDTMPKMLRRLNLDLYYLSHRSWWLDTSIILKTGTSVLFGKVF